MSTISSKSSAVATCREASSTMVISGVAVLDVLAHHEVPDPGGGRPVHHARIVAGHVIAQRHEPRQRRRGARAGSRLGLHVVRGTVDPFEREHARVHQHRCPAGHLASTHRQPQRIGATCGERADARRARDVAWPGSRRRWTRRRVDARSARRAWSDRQGARRASPPGVVRGETFATWYSTASGVPRGTRTVRQGSVHREGGLPTCGPHRDREGCGDRRRRSRSARRIARAGRTAASTTATTAAPRPDRVSTAQISALRGTLMSSTISATMCSTRDAAQLRLGGQRHAVGEHRRRRPRARRRGSRSRARRSRRTHWRPAPSTIVPRVETPSRRSGCWRVALASRTM